jgi:hypothetical protein
MGLMWHDGCASCCIQCSSDAYVVGGQSLRDSLTIPNPIALLLVIFLLDFSANGHDSSNAASATAGCAVATGGGGQSS